MNFKRFGPVLAASISSCALLALIPAGAFAGTQIGQDCTTNSGGPPQMFQTAASSGASYVVPSNGILVKWGTRTGTIGQPVMTAATFATQSGSDINVVRWTPFQLAADNAATEFPARIPVVAGELLGMSVYNGSASMCSGFTPTADLILYGGGSPLITPGNSFTPGSAIPSHRVPIWGVIEADADGDGFGDETQDKCPQSADYVDACPVLEISQKLSGGSKQINVLATASVNTSLTATAKVKLSKKKTVTVTSKATAAKAGKLTTVKLTLPKSVVNAIKQLKKGKSLSASVTLTGQGIANTATATGKVKLKK